RVWKNISSKLQEKERKRTIVPIWYRVAGVAALLALYFNFASGLFKATPISQDALSTTQPDNDFGEFSLISDSYNQDMFRSSIILQALILDTKKAELQENLIAQSKRENFRAMVTAGDLTNSGIERASRSRDIAFNIPGNLALENSVPQKETPVFKLNDFPEPIAESNFPTRDENTQITPVKRLRITTTAAPVYFDNMGSGNAIDSRFADNASGGEISIDRKSTRLNSSHVKISYAVCCLKKKTT